MELTCTSGHELCNSDTVQYLTASLQSHRHRVIQAQSVLQHLNIVVWRLLLFLGFCPLALTVAVTLGSCAFSRPLSLFRVPSSTLSSLLDVTNSLLALHVSSMNFRANRQVYAQSTIWPPCEIDKPCR